MTYQELVSLAQAGFTSAQIQAIAAQAQAPAQASAPAQAQAIAPTVTPAAAVPIYPTATAQPYQTAGGTDMASMLQQILNNQQRANMANSMQPPQQTSQDIIASIINPPQAQVSQKMPDVSEVQNLNGFLLNK